MPYDIRLFAPNPQLDRARLPRILAALKGDESLLAVSLARLEEGRAEGFFAVTDRRLLWFEESGPRSLLMPLSDIDHHKYRRRLATANITIGFGGKTYVFNAGKNFLASLNTYLTEP